MQARGVLPRLAGILAAARAIALPVFYVNKETRPGLPTTNAPIFRIGRRTQILLEGSWGAEVHATIAPANVDYVVRRVLGIDASYGSPLFEMLHAIGRDFLIVAGVATNFAVEGTVRGAINRLFEVVVVEDCCASVPDEMHRFSIERILPLLATITTSDDILQTLVNLKR